MPLKATHRSKRSLPQDCYLKTEAGDFSYRLLKSPRRTTMQITVTEQEQVRVTVPSYVTQGLIESFLRERAKWILDRLQEAGRANQFVRHREYVTGHEFLFLGKNYPLYVERLQAGQRSQISFDEHGWTIRVPAGLSPEEEHSKVKERLVRWYREEAQEVMAARLFHYVRVMNLEPMTIAVKTQKRIWGSCSFHDKTVSLNWLLVLAPLHVIDYVIVHELAHLKHPNHSKRFWAQVESVLPDFKERQDWLKAHRLEMKLP